MARRGRRYDTDSKLNVKKIIAVIVFILVIIMFIFGIRYLLKSNSNSSSGMIETVSYYTIYDNGKWGVINSSGEIIIEATYDEMIVIPDSTKAVFICTYDVSYDDGTYKTKAINAKGKEIIQGYDNVEAISNYDKSNNIWYEENVLRVEKDGKYGLCDFSGNEILACEYDKIESLNGIENSLIIEKDGKYGLSDDLGNIIIEPNYIKIEGIDYDYKNGYIVVNEENQYGIIGYEKSTILECKYEEVTGVYTSSYFVVKENGQYIVINKAGETVLDSGLDEIEDINGDYLIAKKDNKYGVINSSGETKINFEYESLSFAGSSLYIAKKDSKYGIIDTDGNEKVSFDAIDISYITSGDFIIADYIEDNELISKVMDTTNFEVKITGIVSEINETKGYLRVYTEDTYKYYNFKFEEKSSSSILTTNTLFLSKKDGKYGFVDEDGNVVVDYIYDDATEQNSSGYVAVKKDGLWGSLDAKGNVVIEPEYNLDNNTKIDFIGLWHICEDTNANYYLDV